MNYEVKELKDYSDPNVVKFKVQELVGKFPEGVDPAKKECYLTDSDFEEVFKMTREEFLSKKGWQRVELKKQLGLF